MCGFASYRGPVYSKIFVATLSPASIQGALLRHFASGDGNGFAEMQTLGASMREG
jgi:hypothetical protein